MTKILDRNTRLNLAYQNLQTIPQDVTDRVGLYTEELDLTNNRISDLKWLLDYPALESIVLDHNHINSHVKMPHMPQLHTLWVNHNRITNLNAPGIDTIKTIPTQAVKKDQHKSLNSTAVFIGSLAKNCPNLRILSMMNNEAAPSYFNNGSYPQYVDYRHYVISKLPKLEVLDDKKVETRERQEAERIYRPVNVTKRKSKVKKEKRHQSEANGIEPETNGIVQQ